MAVSDHITCHSNMSSSRLGVDVAYICAHLLACIVLCLIRVSNFCCFNLRSCHNPYALVMIGIVINKSDHDHGNAQLLLSDRRLSSLVPESMHAM